MREFGDAIIVPTADPYFMFFNGKDDTPILELRADGDIFVKGKLIENDKEVVDGMREFLRSMNR